MFSEKAFFPVLKPGWRVDMAILKETIVEGTREILVIDMDEDSDHQTFKIIHNKTMYRVSVRDDEEGIMVSADQQLQIQLLGANRFKFEEV